MIEARIILKYEDERVAESIFESIHPDDFESSDLAAKTSIAGKDVITEVKCLELGTLAETLDDLLSCVQVAERTIEASKRVHI